MFPENVKTGWNIQQTLKGLETTFLPVLCDKFSWPHNDSDLYGCDCGKGLPVCITSRSELLLRDCFIYKTGKRKKKSQFYAEWLNTSKRWLSKRMQTYCICAYSVMILSTSANCAYYTGARTCLALRSNTTYCWHWSSLRFRIVQKWSTLFSLCSNSFKISEKT